MERDECISGLKGLTGKKEAILTDRGNSSISASMKVGAGLGKKKIVLQDQGGWITYHQYAKKLKLEIVEVKTDYGLLTDGNLGLVDAESIVLWNSAPGYFVFETRMEDMARYCKNVGAFLINDASGSIGTPYAKHGDIVLGSFGKWKPLWVEHGGFVAFDDVSIGSALQENLKKGFDDSYAPLLLQRIGGLQDRISSLISRSRDVKSRLEGFDVIKRDMDGFNAIVRFNNLDEKQKIVDFCTSEGLEYTECPRYIRVLDDAISIEVKRKG